MSENQITTSDWDTVEVSYAPNRVTIDITSWDYAKADLTPAQARELGNLLLKSAQLAAFPESE